MKRKLAYFGLVVLCILTTELTLNLGVTHAGANGIVAFLTPTDAQFTFTSLQFPGADITAAFGINNHGQIVGAYRITPPRHALLINKGQFTPLDPSSALGAAFSQARNINDRGDVVGTYIDGQGNLHMFLLSQDVLTNIDFPGGTGTFQLSGGINDSGTIVGDFFDSAGALHGFVLRAGVFTQIDVPGAVDTQPLGINARGDIVGDWDTNINTTGHGFVLTKFGQFISFDEPSAAPESTAATGINDKGEIVGVYSDPAGVGHCFLAVDSNFTTIDFPGADTTACWGINNKDEIVGNYTAGTLAAGFLATPTH